MIALKSLLVATDFSEASESALRYGRALAHAFGATLHLVHVVPDPLLSFSWAGSPEAGVGPGTHRVWTAEAQTRLELLVSPRDRAALRAQLAVLSGEPVRQILEYAMNHRIGLVVLGTRGKGPVEHLLLGSVAERVVRFAPCPVLTVRPDQHEFVHETVAPARVMVPSEAFA
jgi:universal stress protein A